MDILNQGIKMRIIAMLFFGYFISCNPQNKIGFQRKVENYVSTNFESYSDLYSRVNLWIDESKKARLENVKSFIFSSDYQVDSLLLLNEKKTRLVGCINLCLSDQNNVRSDYVFMFWGVKIKNEWHFTRGGTLHVPRENYKYNIYESLSHFQLSYIGRVYFLKPFLHIEGDKISVNSDLIDQHVSIRDGYKYMEDSDENWLKFFEERYSKKISQEEIDRIKENIRNEKEERQELPKKGTSAWKELYGTKIPLFEREEWKAYEAQINQSH